MQNDEIKALIEAGIDGCEAIVTGDGSHFQAIVVSESFVGESTLNKQRSVYATLGDRITSGEIHAMTIKDYTPAEWAQAQKLQIG